MGKRKFVSKNLSLIVTGIIALGLVGLAAYIRLSRQVKTASTEPRATNPSTPSNGTSSSANGAGANGTSSTSSSNVSPVSNTGKTPPTDPKYNSATLLPPIQTFNKSHTPISLSQTDSSQPNYPSLDSTCQSVAGATCEIHAVLGSTDKLVSGPATVTDNTTGTIDLPWNAKNLGLVAGTWTILAVARKDGHSSTSTSNYSLVINP